MKYDGLVDGIAELLEQSRRATARAINGILTATYWEIGRRIVEHEQGGQPRAQYGSELLKRLATDLTARFGRGFSERNLRQMRFFYHGWEIWQTPSAKFEARARLSMELIATAGKILPKGSGIPQNSADTVCGIRRELFFGISALMVTRCTINVGRKAARPRVLRSRPQEQIIPFGKAPLDTLKPTQPMSSIAPSHVAVVTGGARGIGLGIAEWFLAAGYRVAFFDIDVETLAQTEKRLNDPARVLAVPCDVSSPGQVQAAVDQVAAVFGRIDALVNNAGVAIFKPIAETTYEEWRHVLATNLDGAFLCTQACAPVMLENGGGSVVNIASISGLRASTLRVAYGTSKAALIHLTKQQAVELGTRGIRVNAIAPGPVDTDMAKLVHSVAIRADYHDVIPLNRYGTIEEIAAVAGFLCSPAASYINGQVLAVDGGFEATGVGLPTLRALRETGEGGK